MIVFSVISRILENKVVDSEHFTTENLGIITPKVDINGDYNRDGTPVDNDKENDEVDFLKKKGMVVLVNCDDDDKDKKADCEDKKINGVADKAKISILNLTLDTKNLSNDIKNSLTAKIDITVHNDGEAKSVRLFHEIDKLDSEGFTLSKELDNDWVKKYIINQDKAEIGIEGIAFGEQVTIKVEFFYDGNKSLGIDEIRVLTSPFMVLSNADKAIKMYANEYEDEDNPNDEIHTDTFKISLTNALAGVIPIEWEAEGQFIQDKGEFGYISNSKTNRATFMDTAVGAQTFFYDFPSTGKGYFSTGFGSTGDLEASPSTDSFPYGRVILGKKYPTGHAERNKFFKKQKLQTKDGTLIGLDTSWLKVGHVDEVFTIVPVGSGYKVLVADLDLAIQLLHDNEFDEVDEFAGLTRRALLDYYDNNADVAFVKGKLQAIRKALVDGLKNDGIANASIIRVPVLFFYDGSDPLYLGFYNYLPNMINMIAVKNGNKRRLCISDPLFDPFFDDITTKLKAIGFNDNELWEVHTYGFINSYGGAHCVSNSEKEAPQE